MISNLHKATTLSNSRATRDDIVLNGELFFRSPFGGMSRYVCIHIDCEKAVFRTVSPSAPEWDCYVVEFDVDDLTSQELGMLSQSVKLYEHPATKTKEIAEVVSKADKLGYISIASQTQAYWTPWGAERYKAFRQRSMIAAQCN
ncbi:hypothetical protein [Vibrio fluvialis]|uniref:hypothetical protein n=1 Tax=Vibrio fluvialis TaxID=676 RepID=UPI00192B6C05|nr:hypothetical protein [Vibrio fluvialis]MBL4262788.1 hypothetical protein [Vibrio fluvialis]